jgi:hypothetical protein
VIKRLGSDEHSSLLESFSAIAEQLQNTASSEHTIKSNFDAIINLIKGFQPSLKERSQLIHAWKVKTFLKGQKHQKLDSVIGIEKDTLQREISVIAEEIKRLEA